MSLKVLTRVQYGNAAAAEVIESGDVPEVRFAADPNEGPESLWFCFRLQETEPNPERQTKVRLVLRHFDNMLGAGSPADCLPVCQTTGQGWVRLKHGEEQRLPDGRRNVTWLINHPNPWTDIAFCYPYGHQDVDALVARSKDYWQRDTIGLSQGGRSIVRLSNSYGSTGNNQPGIYLIARQHSGETPGSWVLDGLLQHVATIRKAAYVVWAVPLAGIDGVMRGDYGKDSFPYDLNRAWGEPPMRHEALVIRRDIQRWKERCRPALALDLHAPGACEKDGVYAFVPDAEANEPLAAECAKWANTLQNELKAEYAAADFRRVARYPSRWTTPDFASYMRRDLGVCALSLETPYAMAGNTVLTQKIYREIGRRLADAIFRRHG